MFLDEEAGAVASEVSEQSESVEDVVAPDPEDRPVATDTGV